jgi:hypothetical protein
LANIACQSRIGMATRTIRRRGHCQTPVTNGPKY